MDSPVLHAFAQNLVRYRKQKGLSQYTLADATGISRRVISHYETHATDPSLVKLEIIAKTLNIKVAKLLEEPDTEKQDAILDISLIDPRSLRKLKDILSLPLEDRNVLYRVLNELLRKNQLEQEQSSINPGKKRKAAHVAGKTSTYTDAEK